MAQDSETFNKDLYDLLKVRGYQPVPLNDQNQRVPASQEAEVMEFSFKKDGKDFGKAWISVEDASRIVVYFSEEQRKSPNSPTAGVDFDDTWTGLLKHLKVWAQRRQLGFELANKDRLGDDMKQRQYYKQKAKVQESKKIDEVGDTPAGKKALGSYIKKASSDLSKNQSDFMTGHYRNDLPKLKRAAKKGEKREIGLNRAVDRLTKVDESYYPVNKKTTYNDAVPAVKIILQHSRNLEEGEQRYRNVARIFLENGDGERFLAPTTKPGLAKVYARHIAEGGLPNDDKWNHIKNICEEYAKLGSFVRATRNKEFNESAQQLIENGVEHYQELRKTLGKMASHNGYHNYFESWTPMLMEDELDESINELFVQEMIDPRIESAMPILAKLKGKSSNAEVESLAEWADGIINEKLELEEHLDEARYDDLGYEIKGNKKSWGLYRTDPKTGKEKLISKHHNKPQAQAAKSDQIGMMRPEKGEKFTVKKIESIKESPILGKGMSIAAKAADVDQSDREYIQQRQFKDNWKKENPGKKWPGYSKAGFVSTHDAQLNELSTDTIERYMDKADRQAMQAHNKARAVGRRDGGEAKQLYNKRTKGLANAGKKLGGQARVPATESVSETFKRVDDYAAWHDDYVVKIGGEYDETYIEDELLGVAWTTSGVRGIWYNDQNFGTISSSSYEDVSDYIQNDPNSPWLNEGLDKNQKKAGQLGPTEKVGKNGPRGKLVGESGFGSDYEERNELDDLYDMDLPKPGDAVVIDGKNAIVGAETDQDAYGGPAEFEVHYEDGTIKIHSVDSILEGSSEFDGDEDMFESLESIAKLAGIQK